MKIMITTYNYYTGIGSRSCPALVGSVMTDIAKFLYTEQYILRSGGAPGADTYFENGVTDDNYKEIYLARKGDFGNKSKLFGVSEEALNMAKKIHPAWNSRGMTANNGKGRELHARNCYQVLGLNLDNPSNFLLCWTEDGNDIGGSRTAIILAKMKKIPILNFGKYNFTNAVDYSKVFEDFYFSKVIEY
jgi:hypothetical protein